MLRQKTPREILARDRENTWKGIGPEIDDYLYKKYQENALDPDDDPGKMAVKQKHDRAYAAKNKLAREKMRKQQGLHPEKYKELWDAYASFHTKQWDDEVKWQKANGLWVDDPTLDERT